MSKPAHRTTQPSELHCFRGLAEVKQYFSSKYASETYKMWRLDFLSTRVKSCLTALDSMEVMKAQFFHLVIFD